jgi:hypothetical protein
MVPAIKPTEVVPLLAPKQVGLLDARTGPDISSSFPYSC